VVEIVVPRRARLPSIPSLLASRQAWIRRHLERLERERAAESGRLPYLGAEYRLVVERAAGRAAVTLGCEVLHVCLPCGADPHAVLESWYREEARVVLSERVTHWAAVTGISYRRVTIRDQRTRWGSCSVLGNLNLSWRLVMAPPAVIDYVVVHELMHLREMHHGPRFWEAVREYCPGYDRQRAWLRVNGRRLSRVLGEALPAPPQAEPADG
jgi:predicted metal-dependent hydrolase